jgi:hypothetical protein
VGRLMTYPTEDEEWESELVGACRDIHESDENA